MSITSEQNILNVTLLPPREKHPTIFARFDQLAEGESLIIYNDHDPKPLYYQLLGERGNVFTWQYTEQGPEWWKVRISKQSGEAARETLGELAAKDLRKAAVFKKYGLDFCCGGKKTVHEACHEKGLDPHVVEEELQTIQKTPATRTPPYNDWDIAFLADYIVHTHHQYVRNTLPELLQYSKKVASVHGGKHPELIIVQQLVEEINTELSAHLQKEEKILFPYIKQLSATAGFGPSPSRPLTLDSAQGAIAMMEMEHEIAGKLVEEIKTLTGNYALPEDACASYTLLFRQLEAFEEDLHLHVHLENNILFPKALAAEKEISV